MNLTNIFPGVLTSSTYFPIIIECCVGSSEATLETKHCNIRTFSGFSKNFPYQRQLSSIVVLSKTLIKPQLDSMVLLFNVIRPTSDDNETQQRVSTRQKKSHRRLRLFINSSNRNLLEIGTALFIECFVFGRARLL